MIKVIANLDLFTYKCIAKNLDEINDLFAYLTFSRRFLGNGVKRIVLSIKGEKENDKN